MIQRATFYRLLNTADKETALKLAVRGALPGETFIVSLDGFEQIPGAPFAYSLSERARGVFRRHPKWTEVGRSAHQGLATADNFRFVRAWWEVEGGHWRPLSKGATRVPFYSELALVMNWKSDGAEMKAWAGSLYNNSHWSRIMMNAPLYFTAGITYSRRPHQRGWFQFLPPGAIFSTDSPLIVGGTPDEQLVDCALLNSLTYSRLLGVLMARGTAGGQTLKYETGYVSSVPLPVAEADAVARLADFARLGFEIACDIESDAECSRYFSLPRLLRRRLGLNCRESSELKDVLARLDAEAEALYGLQAQDLRAFGADAEADRDVDTEDNDGIEEEQSEDSREGEHEAVWSWAVGVSFSRFDPALGVGERPPKPAPRPFEPLSSISPGMSAGTPPADLVLVDDPGHSRDIVEAAGNVLAQVGIEAPNGPREWFTREFFSHHLAMYTRSRRKAPIYWQLATSSASYSIWLYIHAFTKDTLFRVQNDYVGPKLAHEERRLETMTQELRQKATAAQRKELAVQEGFVAELSAFLDEVKRVAPLWNPKLDDGVVINFAPLWRLVPQNKSWQKELKSTWDALCEGKYDWAYLAMRLWPERVVPLCAKDRSLAIAHGLDDVFWVEDTDGKWTTRKAPTRSVEELVRERTSPAAKSALKSLLEAPAATGNTGRGRGDRRKFASEGGNA